MTWFSQELLCSVHNTELVTNAVVLPAEDCQACHVGTAQGRRGDSPVSAATDRFAVRLDMKPLSLTFPEPWLVGNYNGQYIYAWTKIWRNRITYVSPKMNILRNSKNLIWMCSKSFIKVLSRLLENVRGRVEGPPKFLIFSNKVTDTGKMHYFYESTWGFIATLPLLLITLLIWVIYLADSLWKSYKKTFLNI